jgi:hypothetical protein
MIQGAIYWLEKHRIVNLILVCGYAAFLLFAHDIFVNLSVAIMNALSMAIYEKVVAIVLVLIAIGLVGTVFSVVRNGQLELRFVGFFGVTLLLLIAHFFVLTEMNIEFIHAVIYGLLALLLFPLVGRFGGAVLLGLPIMIFDEWYQHIILFPHYTMYFEFNDVVLDLLGASVLISGIGMLGAKSSLKLQPIYMRLEVWFIAIMAFVTVILISSCSIVPFSIDSCENTWLVLNKLPELHDFWYVHPAIGSIFHILKPMEGVLMIIVICVAYLGMDFRSKKREA